MSTLREADGFKWVDRGPGSDDHLSFGGHEKQLEPIVFGLASLDRAYLNIGAHVGLWALRMVTHSKLVWAIEANKFTYDVLCANVANNGCQKRVYPILAAAWDEDQVPLTLTDAQGKTSGGSTRVGEIDYLAATILSEKIDSIFPSDEDYDIGLIQMDVEGAEAAVLRGARQLINKDRPNLLIELHEGHPGTAEDLRAQVYGILSELGYSYHSVTVAGSEEHIIAMPDELEEFPSEPVIVYTD